VTSYVKTTTYVCPSAGTHTIGAMTTTVTKSETCVYPVPTNYHPGTYCQPEVVATVTETDYVVFCPYTKVEEQQSTTTSAPAAVQPQETQPAEQPTEQPAKRPVEKPSKQNKESGPNVSQLTNNGNQWAITYTPYDSNTGDCKDAGSVLMDITTIKAKGFSTVRIYSTDCGGLTSVGAACEALGLRMILGIFIDKEKGGIDGARPQIKDIVSWAKWEIVDLIVIGNEAVFGNQCSIDELISFIGECKSAFSAAGYSGPCTTTETIDILQEHQAAICEVVDIVGSNIHAFFNGGVLPENAGDFVCNSQLPIAQNLCPGKKAICLESGWPANGPANGASVASPDAQKKAIDSIMGTCGGDTVLFSFKNDKWKQGAWEQNFGCGGLFGGGSKF
jgi:exo-beta-1,3-glucanase (GH17 family)